MRAGQDLISLLLGGAPGEVVHELVHTLGKLPGAWDYTIFDAYGRPIRVQEPWIKAGHPLKHPLIKTVAAITDEHYTPSVGESKLFWTPLPDPEVSVVYKEVEEAGQIMWKRFPKTLFESDEDRAKRLKRMSMEETATLFDLLSKIFKYDPSQRISAAELSKHPWFTGEFGK
jgi:hypothetical protein